MSDSTSKQGVRGAAVMVAAQLTKAALLVVSVVALSRLLTPDAIGLVAMVTVFVNVGGMLRDFGLSTAALQVKRLTTQQASNLFWMNTIASIVLAGALAVSTPLLIRLYSEPRLAEIVAPLSAVIVLGGLQTQLYVRLARALRYTAIAVTDVAAQVIGLAAAIAGALLGMSYWALVLQALVVSIVMLVSLAVLAAWVPNRPRRDGATKPVVIAGAHLGGASLLSLIASNVDSAAIGAQFGPDQLAQYNRAFGLLSVPIQAIAPLTNVVLPIAHRAEEQGKSYDQLLLRAQFLLGGITVWLFVVAAAVAAPLLPLLLGPGWGPTVGLFQILAIGGAAQIFSTVNYWSFLLRHQERQWLFYNLTIKAISIIAFIACAFISPAAVAVAVSGAFLLGWPMTLLWLRRSAPSFPAGAYFLEAARLVGAGAAGYLLAWATLLPLTALPQLLQIAIGIVAASIGYGLVLAVTPGGIRRLRGAFALLRQIGPSRRRATRLGDGDGELQAQ